MTTERFRVPEVSCEHCVHAITQEVSALNGVQRVNVALDSKTVTVDHGEQVNIDAIINAIKEAGYDQVVQLS